MRLERGNITVVVQEYITSLTLYYQPHPTSERAEGLNSNSTEENTSGKNENYLRSGKRWEQRFNLVKTAHRNIGLRSRGKDSGVQFGISERSSRNRGQPEVVDHKPQCVDHTPGSSVRRLREEEEVKVNYFGVRAYFRKRCG